MLYEFIIIQNIYLCQRKQMKQQLKHSIEVETNVVG